MSNQFKALILNQDGENFSREIKSIEKSYLKHGDVIVKVEYSGLNYKDALILKNGARLVKEFPHIPGIDFSGTVIESENSKFKEGDDVILTGFRVGEIFYGGYSQIAKVNGDFLFIFLGLFFLNFWAKVTPPPLQIGERIVPALALPVPFCFQGFLPPPLTADLFF